MTTEDVSAVVDDLIAKQKLLDAQDREVGQQIVNDANPKTIDAAKRLAANWIGTAAQESRNAAYMTGERDKWKKAAKEAEERAGEFEARLEMERRNHDETRGYRQHTEKLLEELRVELRATFADILGDVDVAMCDVNPSSTVAWRNARAKLVKLKDRA